MVRLRKTGRAEVVWSHGITVCVCVCVCVCARVHVWQAPGELQVRFMAVARSRDCAAV